MENPAYNTISITKAMYKNKNFVELCRKLTRNGLKSGKAKNDMGIYVQNRQEYLNFKDVILRKNIGKYLLPVL